MCHLLPQLKFWEWFGSGQRQTDRKRSGRGAEVLCCQHRLTSELESKSLRPVSNQTVVRQRQIFYKRFSGKPTFTAFLRFLYPWFQIEDTSHLTHFFLSHLWLLLLFMHRCVFCLFVQFSALFWERKLYTRVYILVAAEMTAVEEANVKRNTISTDSHWIRMERWREMGQ